MSTTTTGEAGSAESAKLDSERLAATQKSQDACSVYFARRTSKYVTPFFIRAGLSANQATAVWGLLSLGNTALIYLAMTGYYALVPAIFGLFFLVVVIDCVDGEIARYRGTSSPIGGKLLDGTWHKATEFGLLAAYVGATYAHTRSPWILPISLVLLSGEAIYTYVYERRLTVIRVFAKSSEYINPTTAEDFYEKGQPWTALSRTRRLKTLKGLIQYKSVYFMIVVSYLPAAVLFAGLVLLTAFKHYSWAKLLNHTLKNPPKLPGDGED